VHSEYCLYGQWFEEEQEENKRNQKYSISVLLYPSFMTTDKQSEYGLSRIQFTLKHQYNIIKGDNNNSKNLHLRLF